MWGPNPLILRKKLEAENSLLTVWRCARGEVYGQGLSAFPTHFSGVILSFIGCVGVAQLVSGFISEVIALCVALHLVCLWEEGCSKPSMLPSWLIPQQNLSIKIALPTHESPLFSNM